MLLPTTIKVMRLNKDAKLPTRTHRDDACYDLYCTRDCYISPWAGSQVAVSLALELPKDWMALLYTRSGHGFRGVRVHLGIIDSGYRGDISPFVMNHTPNTIQFKKGDRVAQIFFMPVPKTRLKEVNFVNDTPRGKKGQGSSGK